MRIGKKVLQHCCFVILASLFFCLVLAVLNGNTISSPCQGLGTQLAYIERTTHQVPRPIVIEEGIDVSFFMKEISHEPKQRHTHPRFAFLGWQQPRLSSCRFVVFKPLEETLHGGIPFVGYA